MSNGAATLEVAGAATESRRAAIRAAGTGFSVGRMLAVTRKELRSYFAFPLVYVLSGIFLVLAGYYAYTDLVFFVTIAFSRDIIQNYWQLLFSDIRLCLLLTLPFITMRLFAEERKLGTIELLYTYPLRDGEILGGKYLASVAIFIMMLALTLLYPILHLQHPLVPAVPADRRLPGPAADRMRVHRVRHVHVVAVREPGDGGNGHDHAAAVFLDSQLERGRVHQLVARIGARASRCSTSSAASPRA